MPMSAISARDFSDGSGVEESKKEDNDKDWSKQKLSSFSDYVLAILIYD